MAIIRYCSECDAEFTRPEVTSFKMCKICSAKVKARIAAKAATSEQALLAPSHAGSTPYTSDEERDRESAYYDAAALYANTYANKAPF
jgi:hypothetical protein